MGNQNAIKVGVEVVEITPPIGFPQYRGKSTGIATHLYVKAIVLKQENNYGAIVVCDIINIPRDLSRIVREYASSITGIPFQNISISATHTHTGPILNLSDIYSYANREANGKLTEKDKNFYLHYLIQKIVQAIVTSNNKLEEVTLTTGKGFATGLSFNRRYLMTDGRVRFNPGCLNPRIVKPLGPIDPEVNFIFFTPKASKKPIAALTGFACHADTQGDTLFHSDYPFYLQKQLTNTFGNQFISIFAVGASGDINHINVTQPSDSTKRGWITEVIGNKLANSIINAFADTKELLPSFQVTSNTVYLPIQDYTKEEFEWASSISPKPLYDDRKWLIERRRAKYLSIEQLRKYEAIQPSASGDSWYIPIEIQVFRINSETAIVTLPGEIFVELGLKLKKESPFVNTILIQLANSHISYVPTLKAFSEGDYEPLNSRLVPGAGERMVEEALKLLNNLK